MVTTGQLLWSPSPEGRAQAPLAAFTAWVEQQLGHRLSTYEQVWRWSTDQLEEFWAAIWTYFEVGTRDRDGDVLSSRAMPAGPWFAGARVNYAQEMLRRVPADDVAVISVHEGGEPQPVSGTELRRRVAALAAELRSTGVRPGDRVAAYLPNVVEALVGLLATASIGAIWTACAPDFGTQSVLDRITQVEPEVLLACDGYRFNGKEHDRREVVVTLMEAIPSLRRTIVVPVLGNRELPAGAVSWAAATSGDNDLTFEPMEFDAPLWVLFSSGTTGAPKGIVQSHGGIVLEHLKGVALGSGLSAGDRLYFYCSTSWMVWNWTVGALLVGAIPILYDGSPGYPDVLGSWRVATATGANAFGAGAAYLTACEAAGASPRTVVDSRVLRTVISTGSPLPLSTWGWIYDELGPGLRLDSSSGGTDICSTMLAGSPWLPVYAGELSAPALAVKAQSFSDSGETVVGEVGELVITEPMPSMPVRFWNDPDGSRYHDAYFAKHPGVWSHGDWVEFTPRGSAVITGRSDATLNKAGVRMGSAEVYAVVDPVPGVTASLVVGIELPDGGYYMPLFVSVAAGHEVDAVQAAIRAAIRTQLSPRHLPDDILAVEAIPMTLTGKKIEIPVKRLLQGSLSPGDVPTGSISAPEMLQWFADFGGRRVQPLLGLG